MSKHIIAQVFYYLGLLFLISMWFGLLWWPWLTISFLLSITSMAIWVFMDNVGSVFNDRH